MKCPKCNCDDVKVVDVIHTVENEIYRRRKCSGCGKSFFTVEFDIDVTESFKREWLYYQNKRRGKYVKD